MNALTTHYIRKAALEVSAYGNRDVFIPEAPDWAEVVAEKARVLLLECTNLAKAEYLVNNHEYLLQDRTAIASRIAETLHAIATRSWDEASRKNELAALGADLLRIAFTRMEAIAQHELSTEE